RDEHADAWDVEHLPLLATLAAVEEPLTLDHLGALSGVPLRPDLRRLFTTRWTPYLAESDGPIRAARTHRFYHASLRDFWTRGRDPSHQSRADIALAEELAESTHEAHARIAGHFLDRWGGLDAGLPALRTAKRLDSLDRYGLRYLSAHLEHGERPGGS